MKKRFKAIIAIMMVLVMSVAFFACSKKEEEPTETTTESTTAYIPPTNPFTGNEISKVACCCYAANGAIFTSASINNPQRLA